MDRRGFLAAVPGAALVAGAVAREPSRFLTSDLSPKAGPVPTEELVAGAWDELLAAYPPSEVLFQRGPELFRPSFRVSATMREAARPVVYYGR